MSRLTTPLLDSKSPAKHTVFCILHLSLAHLEFPVPWYIRADPDSDRSDGVLCTPSGSLIAKPCTAEEVAFYESSALHPAFRDFIPAYIGTLSSADQQQQDPLALAAAQQTGAVVLPEPDSSSSATTPRPSAGTSSASTPSGGRKIQTELSIVLENVASGFKRPNVLDVKLGARLWADDALPEKRARLDAVSKETTSSSLGFRICGMKVWTGMDGESDEGSRTNPYETKHEGKEGVKGEVIQKNGYKRYDKWYGRSFNETNVKEGFETFLAGANLGGANYSKLVAGRLAGDLKRLQQAIETEESRFFSSSVLIVYEGDPEALEHALEEEKKPPNQNSQDDEDDDEEEISLEELQQDGTLQLVDVNNLGQPGIPQQAININIGPETAQLADLDDDEDEEDPPKVHDLRLIDFAHANWTPGQGPDENVLAGVRNLVKVFDGLAVE